jgi:hypothetical protein
MAIRRWRRSDPIFVGDRGNGHARFGRCRRRIVAHCGMIHRRRLVGLRVSVVSHLGVVDLFRIGRRRHVVAHGGVIDFLV